MREHDPRLLIGIPIRQFEDKKGLFGSYRISKTRLGEETHQLVVDGVLDSFSIGYQVDDYEIDMKNEIRYLKELSLFDVSLVSVPMNTEAIITSFKDYLTALGIRPDMTLVEKTHIYIEGLTQIINEVRGLSKKGQLLTETKRQELTELLTLCAGMDAVRSDLQSVLAAAPSKLVDQKWVTYQLAEYRKRHILKE